MPTALLILIITATLIQMSLHSAKNTETLDPKINYRQAINLEEACRYLESLYVPEAGLLRATDDSFHPDYRRAYINDNLLAWKALTICGDGKLAAAVNSTLRSKYGRYLLTGRHEVILGWPVSDMFKDREVKTLRRAGEVEVVVDYSSSKELLDWRDYGDRLFIGSLNALLKGNTSQASELFAEGMRKFDGYGINDTCVKDTHLYDTYKLALAVLAYRSLGEPSNWRKEISEILEILSKLQDRESGGIHTGYVWGGNGPNYRVSGENVETTSLVIISLYSEPLKPPMAEYMSSTKVTIATYYYVWYGDSRHWNDTSSNIVVDTPLIGYYSSLDQNVVKWQLKEMKETGINTVFVSWWGPNSYEDNATKLVFLTAPAYGMKVSILIEPYLGQNPSLYNDDWWENVLNYLNSTYISKYPETYFQWEGKPLIMAYTPIGAVYRPQPANYTIRIVGNDNTYADWPYWTSTPTTTSDGYVSLIPRYDDYYLYLEGGRQSYVRIDLGMIRIYKEGWNYVLNNTERVRLVAIATWNEYHERTAIEPHIDRTSATSPYYLISLTQREVKELITLKSREAENGSQVIYIAVVIAASAALAALYLWRKV